MVQKYLWIAIAFVLASLFFAHPDIQHTVSSSYALYSHPITEFYEVNRGRVGGNDYLLSIYVIFALWMVPLKALGLTTEGALPGNYEISLLEIAWAKALLLFAIVLLQRIVDQVASRSGLNKWNGRLLVSPILIWVTLVIGQYDIIWITLLGAGCLLLLRGKSFSAGVFLGLSISIKYFSFVFLFPLFLLLLFTDFRHIKVVATSLFTFVLVFVSSTVDPVSFQNVIRIPTKLVSELPVALLLASGVMVVFGIGLFLALFHLVVRRKYGDDLENLLYFSGVVSLITYPVLFTLLRWNPQWLQIIVVLVLLLTPVAMRKWADAWEFTGIGLLVLTGITFWPRNLDSFMATESWLLRVVNQVNGAFVSETVIPNLTWVIVPMQLWIAIPSLVVALTAFLWLRRQIHARS
jgi:uncharacterized membrane protein